MVEMKRWRITGRWTTFRYIQLVNLGEKPGCLEFLNKAGLDRIPVAAIMMIMMRRLAHLKIISKIATSFILGSDRNVFYGPLLRHTMLEHPHLIDNGDNVMALVAGYGRPYLRLNNAVSQDLI